MTSECILCYEQSKFFGITECNHGPFCSRCIYKMRAINKNNTCPICKHSSKQIMISQTFQKFGAYKGDILPDANFGDVFHCGKDAKREFQKFKQYKCFIRINGNPCKYQKSFDNIAFLKKHLKQQHKRVLCDICLEKKTCVLEEQKLYTQMQLNKHLERGDIDDFGNVIFMHPFCGFCKIHFFDQDQFKRHMNLEHFICNVCGSQHRYTYYKDYNGLQTHYKISHYICSDMTCMAKKFIAFRTAEELKIHRTEAHTSGNKKIDGKQLCGFNYGGISNEQIIQLKDKEGINMQDQFLTLKKSKNRAIGEADKQTDAIIDLRDFYNCVQDEDQHYRDSFILRHKQSNGQKKKQQVQPDKGSKKKKYVDKQQFQKQKPTFAKENQQFTVQQLNLIKSLHLAKIYYDDFQEKLSTLLGKDDLKKVETWRVKHNKRQISSEQFIFNFYEIMKKISLKTGYEIFPHYIRTVQNQEAKQQLDYEYVKTLKKIPTKVNSLLSSCKTYGQLFKKLLHEIQINIEMRIKDKTLSIKRPIRRQKQRLFQLIGVVRRLKTQQMAKFKFASNFGVHLDTSEMLHQKIFKMNEENIQNRLTKIPNQQFIDLYVFVKHCYEAITHNENMHLSKNKIHEHVLEDFLYERPQLDKQFGPKKEDLKTLQEKVQFQKEQQEKNQKNKLKEIERKNKDMGYHSKANFSLSDKSDFPDLVVNKKSEQTNASREDFRDVIDNVKNKPATYQKKINELFPTLGQQPSEQEDQEKKKNKTVVAQKKQKAWWQKINQPKNNGIEQEQEVVKIRKGKGKNQKFVAAKGFFGQ